MLLWTVQTDMSFVSGSEYQLRWHLATPPQHTTSLRPITHCLTPHLLHTRHTPTPLPYIHPYLPHEHAWEDLRCSGQVGQGGTSGYRQETTQPPTSHLSPPHLPHAHYLAVNWLWLCWACFPGRAFPWACAAIAHCTRSAPCTIPLAVLLHCLPPFYQAGTENGRK